MDFGIYGLLRGGGIAPDTLVRRARLAEEAGFESIWVGDHVALPADMDGREPRLEVVVALSHLAAVTTRIRLGFGVIVLPQRQPVLLAKQLSSLDVLSKGRVDVGIGVGYVEPEMHALGASLADRGARTDEYLAAMKTLWTSPAPDFDGRFVSFSGVLQNPRPVQKPHPPITIGGHSAAAFRRAATVADGWYGVYLDVDQTADALAGLRKVVAASNRQTELEITITPPGPVDLDTAQRYADLGVHRLVVRSETAGDTEKLIRTVGETLVGRVTRTR